jgi:hypothetical protein
MRRTGLLYVGQTEMAAFGLQCKLRHIVEIWDEPAGGPSPHHEGGESVRRVVGRLI